MALYQKVTPLCESVKKALSNKTDPESLPLGLSGPAIALGYPPKDIEKLNFGKGIAW